MAIGGVDSRLYILRLGGLNKQYGTNTSNKHHLGSSLTYHGVLHLERGISVFLEGSLGLHPSSLIKLMLELKYLNLEMLM